MIRPGALRPRLRLGHVTAVFGLAVPPVTGAVIDLAGGIDPNLAGASRSRSGALVWASPLVSPRLSTRQKRLTNRQNRLTYIDYFIHYVHTVSV
jgi:hypothetical protein